MHFYIHLGELESWLVKTTEEKEDIKCDLVCETPTCFLMELTKRQPEMVVVTLHNDTDVTPDSLEKAICDVLQRPNVWVEAKGEIR